MRSKVQKKMSNLSSNDLVIFFRFWWLLWITNDHIDYRKQHKFDEELGKWNLSVNWLACKCCDKSGAVRYVVGVLSAAVLYTYLIINDFKGKCMYGLNKAN